MHIANAEEAVNPSNNHSSSQWSRLLDLKRNIANIYPTMAIITVSIAYEKEQRLTRFSINGINTKQPSFTDKLLNFYYKIII